MSVCVCVKERGGRRRRRAGSTFSPCASRVRQGRCRALRDCAGADRTWELLHEVGSAISLLRRRARSRREREWAADASRRAHENYEKLAAQYNTVVVLLERCNTTED